MASPRILRYLETAAHPHSPSKSLLYLEKCGISTSEQLFALSPSGDWVSVIHQLTQTHPSLAIEPDCAVVITESYKEAFNRENRIAENPLGFLDTTPSQHRLAALPPFQGETRTSNHSKSSHLSKIEKWSRPLLFSPKPVLRATSRLKPFKHQPAPSRSLSRNLWESSRVPTMPRVRSPKKRSTRMSEETYARNAAWRTCRKLRKVSTHFKSAKIAKVKDIEDVIFRALSSRLQSHSSIVTHSKHVDSFLRFCARRKTKEPFTGPHSCFILYDFLASQGPRVFRALCCTVCSQSFR